MGEYHRHIDLYLSRKNMPTAARQLRTDVKPNCSIRWKMSTTHPFYQEEVADSCYSIMQWCVMSLLSCAHCVTFPVLILQSVSSRFNDLLKGKSEIWFRWLGCHWNTPSLLLLEKLWLVKKPCGTLNHVNFGLTLREQSNFTFANVTTEWWMSVGRSHWADIWTGSLPPGLPSNTSMFVHYVISLSPSDCGCLLLLWSLWLILTLLVFVWDQCCIELLWIICSGLEKFPRVKTWKTM